MLKLMIDHRGILSLFTLIVLIPIMIISGLIMDFARLKAAQAQAAAAAETYANSYLSVYDELLCDLYGILAISQSGTDAIDELENYMKTSYTPGSADTTHLDSSYNVSGMLRDLISESNYSNAIAPVGNALKEMNATPMKPLSDNNALQMQISEYIKYIGPAELLFNIGGELADMFKDGSGGDSDNESEASNAANDTKGKYDLIKEKNDIDNEISALNSYLENFHKAVKQYDSKYQEVYNNARDYLDEEYYFYRNSIDIVNQIYDKLKDSAEKIAKADLEKQYDENGNQTNAATYIENVLDSQLIMLGDKADFYEYPGNNYYIQYYNIGLYYEHSYYGNDYSTNSADGRPATNAYINSDASLGLNNIKKSDKYLEIINGVNELQGLRTNVQSTANELNGKIKEIVSRIDSLIYEAREYDDEDDEQTFSEGLEDDYSYLLSDDAQEDLAILKSYDFGTFGAWFYSYGEKAENELEKDINNEIEGLCNDYDDSIETEYGDIDDVIQLIYEYGGDNSSELTSTQKKDLQESCQKFGSLPELTYTNIPYAFNNNISGYYILLSDGQTAIPYSGIAWSNVNTGSTTWKNIYDILSRWNFSAETDDARKQSEKDSWDDIGDTLKGLYKSLNFNNISLRCGDRMMPDGETSDDDEDAEMKDLSNLLEQDSASVAVPSTEDKYINKLLLMLYNYGMFTCQTSDKEEDEENPDKINNIAPVSYQGVTLAKKDSEGKYETSKTNFLLYNELEYIFAGNKDPQKNFNKVRNCLAIIRFVPNYINTYTIDEINNIITTVRNALSWCPLAAVLVCQVLRIGIASLETWADLNLLYGGHSILFTKSDFKDLSLIGVLKDAAANNEDARKVYEKLPIDQSSSSSSDSDNSGVKIKINYQQYLILLEIIFVSQEDMIERTGDLIEANMNYVLGNTSNDDNGTTTLNLDWTLAKAYTAVEASCSINTDFIFIGGLFNARSAGYDNVADFADSSGNISDSIGTFTVAREY